MTHLVFGAGVLMIKGAHLQGVEIKAIHGNQSVTLVVLEEREVQHFM